MHRAIKKGEVSKKTNSVGIKFCREHESKIFIEVKINDGERAWSKHIYKNNNDDRLVVIDGFGNHKAAEKAARSSTKLIHVQSDPDVLEHIKSDESEDHDFSGLGFDSSHHDYVDPSIVKEDVSTIGEVGV